MTTSNSTIDTITISSGDSIYTGGGIGGDSGDMGTVTISNGGYTIGATGSTNLIGDINTVAYTWKTPEEFVDAFPEYNRIQAMCECYPGLQIAFEKFKTVYKLVKDDYDNPKD